MPMEKSSVQQYLEDVKKKVPTHWLVWEEIENKMVDAQRMDVLNRDALIDSRVKDILQLFIFKRDEKDKEVEKLFDPSIGGPLVSLPNKARLIYALGLIDETTSKDLETIHKIRNIFAHNVDLDFESNEVYQLVKKLSIVRDKKKPVTMKNSFELYSTTSEACSKALGKVLEKEIEKLAGRKKKKPRRKTPREN